MERKSAVNWLRAAFIAGAVVDAGALVPMLWPWASGLLWGFGSAADGPYMYAMGMGAALMLGWTLLLVWAACKPAERRFIAPLTVVVILGIAAAEVIAVIGGVMEFGRALPSFILQAVLLALFNVGYALARKPGKQGKNCPALSTK